MNIYWVSQGVNFEDEYNLSIIWAPQSGTWHHEILQEIKKGDIILSYYNKSIVSIGIATKDCYSQDKPFENEDWIKEGWQVNIDYRILKKPIKINKDLGLKIHELNKKNGPINKNGTGNQIYCTKLNPETLKFLNNPELDRLKEYATATPTLLLHKNIDWSLFNWGTTIPENKQESFFKSTKNNIQKGTAIKIQLDYNGKLYPGTIRNVDQKKYNRNTLQIRYDTNEPFKELLKEKFKEVYPYILIERKKEIANGMERPHIKVPDKFFIEFHSTNRPDTIEVKFNENANYENFGKEALYESSKNLTDLQIKEQDAEYLKTYNSKYAEVKKTTSKVRVSDVKLKETIKRNHNYVCQICSTKIKYKGWNPHLTKQEEIKFLTADAHHIIPLSENGEDNPENIICVCPNCHKRLHTGEYEIKVNDKQVICLNTITNETMNVSTTEGHVINPKISS